MAVVVFRPFEFVKPLLRVMAFGAFLSFLNSIDWGDEIRPYTHCETKNKIQNTFSSAY